MVFYFGSTYDKSVKIEAKSLEQAIKIFKVKELFPEECTYQKDRERLDYNSVLSRYDYKIKPDAKIPIYKIAEDKNWHDGRKRVGEIFYRDCVQVDYTQLVPSQAVALLPAPEQSEDPNEEDAQLPVVGDSKAIALSDKSALRAKHDELKLKQHELEIAQRQLSEAMNVIKKELKKKLRMLYMLETYLGIKEEIIQLLEGPAASEDVPLTLYQQKLYMDEELGVWTDGGMDFTDLDKWDEWITENYKKFLYEPKSICAFQIRRTSKDYDDNSIVNAAMNENNFRTYFLIRNGENLYRIWSDVHINDRLFPSEEEYATFIKEMKDSYSEEYAKNKFESKHNQYLYGVLAIQGLIERTDLLGTSLRSKVNLIKSIQIPESVVKFVRDDEHNFWVTDGRPTWREFIEKNQESITVGTRVVLINYRIGYRNDSSKDHSTRWRTEPYNPESWPSSGNLYQIEEIRGKSPNNRWGWTLKIYYDGSGYWDKRTRRVPFHLYSSEVINFDAITREECDYYRKNRNERKHYLEVLPLLHWIIQIKNEEENLEKEFTKYIAGQLNWGEDSYKKIREAIDWWKLKNKWKRALTKDEAKAVRMILKKLNEG